jgi:hypothetical protein
MPRITYTGPFDEVDVPAFRLLVKQGETVEVSEDAAVALLEQSDNWTTAKASKKGDAK